MEPTRATTADSPEERARSPDEIREISELVGLFLKALKGYRLYLPNNRTLKGFVEAFHQALARHHETRGELCLNVSQFTISFEGEQVYENRVQEESLAFRLFIHGLRELTFLVGTPVDELCAFLEVLHRAFDAKASADDLLTLLWEKDLKYVTFIVLDDFFEEGEQSEFEEFVEDGRRADDTAGSMRAAIQPILDRLGHRSDSPLPDPDTLDLTEAEVSRLAQWVDEERDREPLEDFCAVLIEIFDPYGAESESREILAAVERVLETLLAEQRFRDAIRLIQELRGYRSSAPGESSAAKLAREALDRIGGERMVRYLEPHFAEASAADADQLVDFLAALDQTAVPILLDLLGKQDAKPIATRTLRRLAEEHLLPAFVARLKDPSPKTLVPVIRLLSEIEDTRAVAPLRGCLAHEDPAVRREAIRAVEAIGGALAFPLLKGMLADPEPDIRVQAVRALSSLSPGTIRRPLFDLAKAPDFRKRSYFEKKEIFLALATATAADPEVEGWLVSLVSRRRWFRRDEHDELRACAISALAKLGTPRSLEALRECAIDPSPQVSRAAAQALRAAN